MDTHFLHWAGPVGNHDERRARRRAKSLEPKTKRSKSHEPRFSWEGSYYPQHVYKHLTSKRGFRTLHVVSCNPVTRQLIGFFFEDNVDNMMTRNYRALSYTWGAALERTPEDPLKRCWEVLIINDGRYIMQNDDTTAETEGLLCSTSSFTSLALGSNLSDFVDLWVANQLNTNQSVTNNLWIDAICIDQKNPDEKQAQIPLMGEIYANAMEVMVWLGKDSSDWREFKWLHETVCPELIKSMSEGRVDRFLTTMSEHDPLDPDFWSNYLPSVTLIHTSWKSCWESYWRFLRRRRWFKRVWTYQEAVLASELNLYCGADFQQLPFDSVGILARLFELTTWPRWLNLHFGAMDGDDLPYVPAVDIWRKRSDITACVAAQRLSRMIPEIPSHLRTLSEESWLDLWVQACQVLRRRSCFLDVDKVNATIGIASLLRPPNVPTQLFEGMARTARDLFIWMSSFFVQNALHLDQLSHGGYPSLERFRELATKRFPTWATDFAMSQDYCPVICVSRFDASLTRGKGPRKSAEVDGEILITPGVMVDKIKDVLGADNPLAGEWFLHHVSKMEPLYTSTNQTAFEALWRTMIWDCALNSSTEPKDSEELSRPSSEWGQDCKEWLESLFVIKYLFPGYRAIGSPGQPDWWKTVSTKINSMKACGERDGPSASNIWLTAHRIQQHPEWLAKGAPVAVVFGDPANIASQFSHFVNVNWNTFFAPLAASIKGFRSVYEKAFSARFPSVKNRTMQGRLMFDTNSGLLGLGHFECKAGDEVWLLAGGRVPYVLRPSPNADGTYFLIGDCYVHGIMEGEFLSRYSGDVEWKTIRIA